MIRRTLIVPLVALILADASTTIARRHFTIDLSDRPPPRRTIR
jgi:hypothetical protein